MIRLLALAALVAAPVATASASAPAPARLGVSAKEFRFSLSRTTVRSGPILIELDNFGEDVHDLRLRRVGATRTYTIPETASGSRAELDTKLRPGVYRLWCSVADHRLRGMRATLRVR
jgi:hypothetical protein